MEGECQGCADLEFQVREKDSAVYDLECQVRRLQDDIEDLHAKLAAKNGPVLTVAARQIVFHRNMLFMLDAAGTLWATNELNLVERYKPIEWERLTLPEVANG
jgi:hypothetical protein